MKRKYLWPIGLVAATFIISLAIISSVVRSLTPYLSIHQNEIAQWIGKKLDRPLKIGKIEAYWQGIHPVIRLSDVTLYSHDNDHPKRILHCNHINLVIDLIDTAKRKQIDFAGMELSGVKLAIRHLPNNHWLVNGVESPLPEEQNQSLNIEHFFSWLCIIDRIQLKNIHIRWQSAPKQPYALFQLSQLAFSNDNKEHHLVGVIKRLKKSERIQFIADIHGTPKQWQNISAKVFLQLKHIHVNFWRQLLAQDELPIKGGLADGNFWLQWKNNKTQRLQSFLNIKKITIFMNFQSF